MSVSECLLVCIRDCADTLHRYTLNGLMCLCVLNAPGVILQQCWNVTLPVQLYLYMIPVRIQYHAVVGVSGMCVVRFVCSLERHSNLWP